MKKAGPEEVAGFGHGEQQSGQQVGGSVNVLRSCDEGNLRLVVLNCVQHKAAGRGSSTEVVDCVVSMESRRSLTRAAIRVRSLIPFMAAARPLGDRCKRHSSREWHG